jgi:vitamin B12 transporter
MKKFISHIVLLHFYAIAIGQTQPDTSLTKNSGETTKVLTEVNILSPKFNVGTKTDTCSKLNQLVFSGRFLADILASFGHAYLKQTAPGQLATISLNGGNTSQTQVNWQGINLNNPATGQTDFSLVPAALFSDISVLNGSTGASVGSGSVSGTVILKNNPVQVENSWNVLGGIHYGSFGRISSNAGFDINKNKINFKAHLFYVDFKNNFTYTDFFGTDFPAYHIKLKKEHFQLRDGISKIKGRFRLH